MIDVLPTLLELLEMPRPEVIQGQSLAPLLRGEPQRLRPVVLDEFRMDDETGEMVGNIELVDGAWGASLEIGPGVDGGVDGGPMMPDGCAPASVTEPALYCHLPEGSPVISLRNSSSTSARRSSISPLRFASS